MIFLYSPAGNHSNLLFQTIHFESYCLEKNFKFVNYILSDFSFLYGLPSPRFKKLQIFFIKIFKKFKLLNFFNYEDSENENYPAPFTRHCIVSGWHYRQIALVNKYKSYFQNKYTLLPKFYENSIIYQKYLEVQKLDFVTIGIHIRLDDYKTFCDGKYFFTTEVYLAAKKRIENLLRKNAFFFFFSNEKLSSDFNSANCYISKESWYVDQFIMSKLDYLLGPPSTFTSWASFIGNVKLKFIENTDNTFTMEDFYVYKG